MDTLRFSPSILLAICLPPSLHIPLSHLSLAPLPFCVCPSQIPEMTVSTSFSTFFLRTFLIPSLPPSLLLLVLSRRLSFLKHSLALCLRVEGVEHKLSAHRGPKRPLVVATHPRCTERVGTFHLCVCECVVVVCVFLHAASAHRCACISMYFPWVWVSKV